MSSRSRASHWTMASRLRAVVRALTAAPGEPGANDPDGSPTWPPPAPVPSGRQKADPSGGGRPDPSLTDALHPSSVAAEGSAVNLRFALIDQRLALISERLELVSERLAGLSTSRVAESRPQAARKRLGPKASDRLPVEHSEGTLRPPRVPRDLGPLPSDVRGRPQARPPSNAAGPIMTGTTSGISLGSLFSLLEFERCSGGLSIRGDDHHVELSIQTGNVTRCELDAVRVSPSAALREVFTWRTCTFAFRRDEVSDEDEAPQSVNALLLEAMRVLDEDRRTG